MASRCSPLVFVAALALIACSDSSKGQVGCISATSVLFESKRTPTWPEGNYALSFSTEEAEESCTTSYSDGSRCTAEASRLEFSEAPTARLVFVRPSLSGSRYSLTLWRDGVPLLSGAGQLRYQCLDEACQCTGATVYMPL